MALILAVGGALVTSLAPPIPGHGEADRFTVIASGVAYVVAGCAGLLTVARLLRATWLSPTGSSGRHWQRVCAAAALWCGAALVAAVFNAGASQGLPVSYVIADPFTFLFSVQTTQAWLLTALIAAVVVVATFVRRRRGTQLVTTILAVGAQLPVVITAQVSVGRWHDLASDAAIVMTLAITVAMAALWGAAGLHRTSPEALLRALRMAAVGLVIAIPLRIGVAVFELAGERVWVDAYGWSVLTQISIWLAILGVTVTAIWRPDRTARRSLIIRVSAGLSVIAVGVWAAQFNLVPPRFLLPQSIAENYLGYAIPTEPSVVTAFLPGRPNVLLAAVAVVAIVGYGIGFASLRRRGDRWPLHRLAFWTVGWLLVLAVACSSAWALSSVTFSWHMGVHMVLSMLAPPLIVLGGVITLALQVLPAAKQQLPRLRGAVVALMKAPVVMRLSSPLVVWLFFVGSFYVLYFTPLFGSAMRFHWGHQVMTFHFLIMGCLFYGAGIGVDRPPRDLPPVARLALIFAAMPFHSFFSIAVLSGTGIGKQFYEALDVAWIADLGQDQQIGGQIGWAMGEVPMLIVVIAMLAQWFAQDSRAARRGDRQADRDADSELAAYNELLAELARRDKESHD